MIARAQASLPGRKPPAKKSALEGALSALSPAKSARKPSKKGIAGGLVGAVAVAAVAKRRRDNQEELSMTSPAPSAETPAEAGSPAVPPVPPEPPVPPVAPPVALAEPTPAAAIPGPIDHAADSPQKRKEKTGKESGKEKSVEIPKEQIVRMLRDRGDHDQAQQADQQLPDPVNPEQHTDLLRRIGINPSDIPGRAGGTLGR